MKYTPVLIKDITFYVIEEERSHIEIHDKIKELKAKFPSKNLWVETITHSDGEIKDKVFLSIERHFNFIEEKGNKKVVIKDKGWKLLFNCWLFLQSNGHEISDYWTTDVDMDFETIIKLQEKIKEAFEWAKEVDSNLDKLI